MKELALVIIALLFVAKVSAGFALSIAGAIVVGGMLRIAIDISKDPK